ncbi:MAG: ribose-phosphate diphosphokinase [Thalassolituus sp.]|jgi:ribose-phosphate pyrophosphokinase|tara:strand:+ start:672 stop:1565 length:894 start_codon:yes stop_codon:yes gene_type:complete
MNILCLDQEIELANAVANLLGCECVTPEQRYFPDGEHYLRFSDDIFNEDVFVFFNLHQPDNKILPLLFTVGYLRDRGVKRIVLVTPYLPYMRQDIQFKSGECVTSRYFSKIVSDSLDGLITVDPHLHRYHSLDEIYSIPSTVIHATNAIAEWITNNVEHPVIIGPDDESRQWAETVAQLASCPVTVLRKTRLGDRDVRVEMEDSHEYKHHQPVMVDDIISTGKTVIETSRLMALAGMKSPVVIGVHAVLAKGAATELDQSLIASWLTCNTISHASNGIDLSTDIATAIRRFWTLEKA